MRLAWRAYRSPIGPLRLECGLDGVTSIRFGGQGEQGPSGEAPGDEPCGDLDALVAALDRYFAGESACFDGVRLASLRGEFARLALGEVGRIEPGRTCSYAQVARAIGRPSAVRAVARANATNPLPIVIPCHRVIGSDGSLTGYGGGLEAKRWLLDHEQRYWGAGLLTGV